MRQLDGFVNRSYRYLRPRPSDPRMFGELELSHHDPAGVRAYFRVEASTFVTMAP